LSPWRKLTVSAAATWPCSGCNVELSVPWWDFAVAAVCLVPPMLVVSPVLAEVAGTIIYVGVHQFAVPLVIRGRQDR
jgi:hypothetical protein